jgi:hypothetical protein
MELPPFDDVETFVFFAVAAMATAGRPAAAATQAPPINNLRRDMAASLVYPCPVRRP